MSKILSSDTAFERKFIEALTKKTKKKFEVNVNDIVGKPDLVFYKNKLCIFLDSDFWHGWQYPRWKHTLKNNYWKRKIEKTRKRDTSNTIKLKRMGWRVMRIWEHALIKNYERPINKVIKMLK